MATQTPQLRVCLVTCDGSGQAAKACKQQEGVGKDRAQQVCNVTCMCKEPLRKALNRAFGQAGKLGKLWRTHIVDTVREETPLHQHKTEIIPWRIKNFVWPCNTVLF